MKLEVTNLAVARGERVVFSGVSFGLSDGDALQVIGPNGSGKSTLLRAIITMLPLREGHISCSGEGEIAEHCHYLGHKNALKPAMSVAENLDFWQKYAGSSLLAIDDALQAVGLGGIEHIPAGYLSAGQKRRVAIARLLVTHRPIWLVDEPTAALDKASEKLFTALLNDYLDKGGIVIAATHQSLGLDNPQLLDLAEYAHQYEPTGDVW